MATYGKPTTDPAVYKEYEAKWAALPSDEAGWVQRAKDVAAVLAPDAGEREKANKAPIAEVQLLKYSGLTKVLGPVQYGGGGQPWTVAHKVIREVSRADGSIGMLLGYHLNWSTTASLVGSDEQADRYQKLIISNNYFVGGAVNPRDSDLVITTEGEGLVFNGFKNFNTGGVVSDLTVLEGDFNKTGNHIFAFVPTQQPGIQFQYNWDNIGLRLTESGSVAIRDVKVPWADALGWDAQAQKPDPAVLGVPYATLLLPSIQLVFSNLYLGITQGALDFAAAYTKKTTRAWPYGGENKENGTDEFYVLSTYGNFFAHVRAAEALADKAGQAFADLLAKHAGNRGGLTAQERGEVAEWAASFKVVATDTGLRVTAGVFEVTGARATASKVDLDRFWRDIRTHSLHDPVAYKNRELGRYLLVGEIPTPSWYT